MLNLILNNEHIGTYLSPGMPLLDFIRYHQHLTGTKTGCNEGDCGACTVLIGEIRNNELQYRTFTSCLTPLGNVQGKHVVTIEGINMETLTPVQQAMVDLSAMQCGFCTPGFIMSLTGFCLNKKDDPIAAIDGNICRCTGYKSIERATIAVKDLLAARNGEEPLEFAINNNIVPAYFKDIKERLQLLPVIEYTGEAQLVAGGTDLYVQKPEELPEIPLQFAWNGAKDIIKEDNTILIGAAVTVSDLLESPIMLAYFPDLKSYIKKVSSTPIRNMATIAGNFINASPIGDFTIFFLALNAILEFNTGRVIPLDKLYQGYKKLDRLPDEYIQRISFELPSLFHFEKVSKRTHLDIASVNTAINFSLKKGVVNKIRLSAGGVAPVPMLLKDTMTYLTGKKINEITVAEAIQIAWKEISPISDTRGSAEYKRLLLGQLIKAHFITLHLL